MYIYTCTTPEANVAYLSIKPEKTLSDRYVYSALSVGDIKWETNYIIIILQKKAEEKNFEIKSLSNK